MNPHQTSLKTVTREQWHQWLEACPPLKDKEVWEALFDLDRHEDKIFWVAATVLRRQGWYLPVHQITFTLYEFESMNSDGSDDKSSFDPISIETYSEIVFHADGRQVLQTNRVCEQDKLFLPFIDPEYGYGYGLNPEDHLEKFKEDSQRRVSYYKKQEQKTFKVVEKIKEVDLDELCQKGEACMKSQADFARWGQAFEVSCVAEHLKGLGSVESSPPSGPKLRL